MTAGRGTDRTFLFADLAGFTALTEAHGEERAADLAGDFCTAVREMLPGAGAEVVKTIGDAVMVRSEDAAAAVDLGLRIVAEAGAQHGLPSVRVGMNTGPAVQRDGDWFGAGVNVAARVAALAREGEVLITDATRRAAEPRGRAELREHGRHQLKNVGELVLVYRALVPGPRAEELPVDPVCRMAVLPSRSAGRLTHEGVEYVFCSMNCARAFTADPDRYAISAGAAVDSPVKLERALALSQGGAYLYFALWSLFRRADYRRVHRLHSDDWVLNAHGGWLSVVGAALLASAVRRRSPQPVITRMLGFGSALVLALNDARLLRRLAPIYRLDLAFESALAALWALVARPRRRA